MHRRTLIGLLLAVWLMLLGAQSVETLPAAAERVTLRDILTVAEPSLEGAEASDATKGKAFRIVGIGRATVFSCSLPETSAQRIIKPGLIDDPRRIYQLHCIFLI